MESILNRLMGLEEAAEFWGISVCTLKKYCVSGKVDAVKIGNTWILDKLQPKPLTGKHPKEAQPERKDTVMACPGCNKISIYLQVNPGEDPERYICTSCMHVIETAGKQTSGA